MRSKTAPKCIENLPDGRNRQLIEQAAEESGLPVFCKDVARDSLGRVLPGYFSVWTEAYHKEHAPFWDAYRRLKDATEQEPAQ